MKQIKLYNPIPNAKMNIWPIGDIYNGFGQMIEWYRANFGIDGHNGLDINIRAKWGSPIYAAHDGVVRKIFTEENTTKSYGFGIWLTNYDLGIETIYWHLSKLLVEKGQELKTGELIGQMGNTGSIKSRWGTGLMDEKERNSKGHPGSHCHFGLRECTQDPDGSHRVLNQQNGHDGYIDPLPYLEHSMTLAVIGRMLTGIGIVLSRLIKQNGKKV